MSYTGGYPLRPKQLSPGLSVTHQRGKDCGVEEVLDKELPKGTNHGGREGRHKKDKCKKWTQVNTPGNSQHYSHMCTSDLSQMLGHKRMLL